jgi:hypothetical protein
MFEEPCSAPLHCAVESTNDAVDFGIVSRYVDRMVTTNLMRAPLGAPDMVPHGVRFARAALPRPVARTVGECRDEAGHVSLLRVVLAGPVVIEPGLTS